MAAAQVHQGDPSGRLLASRLLIFLSTWPTFFGWLFLWSGIGAIYLLLGTLMLAAGVLLASSRKTMVLAAVAFVVGHAPFLYLLIDIALWKYT
ncbi:MAG: hypothetical protein IT303_12950 [Dehalococcoidia bacterium]|nr:hypothetical protein [Dehalococcoidia bacterium]